MMDRHDTIGIDLVAMCQHRGNGANLFCSIIWRPLVDPARGKRWWKALKVHEGNVL
jgi:hypothetical protein